MKRMSFTFILIIFFVACSATKEMTVSECRQSNYCTITGTASVEEVRHVKMLRLDISDDSCVYASINEKKIKEYESRAGEQITVTGKVFPNPPTDDETLAFIKVNDRRVGWGSCSDFYVFIK